MGRRRYHGMLDIQKWANEHEEIRPIVLSHSAQLIQRAIIECTSSREWTRGYQHCESTLLASFLEKT